MRWLVLALVSGCNIAASGEGLFGGPGGGTSDGADEAGDGELTTGLDDGASSGDADEAGSDADEAGDDADEAGDDAGSADDGNETGTDDGSGSSDDGQQDDGADEDDGAGSTSDDDDGAGESGVDVPENCPPVPGSLSSWIVGNEDDADVDPTGPGLILMGGNFDTDEAFDWWVDYLSGGDVVVLRSSGSDGYNDYLYEDIGGVDSVETLLVDSTSLADDDYVACRVRQAEGVFIAGGSQADYVEFWKDRELAAAIDDVYQRGGVVGGTSAGLAVLGRWVHAAYSGGVYSDEMLDDPYNDYAELETGLFEFPLLARVITDSHFSADDRMGRLVGFLARIVEDGWGNPVVGIGVDEDTSLVVGPDGAGTVVGPGRVYVVHSNGSPATCNPNAPLTYQGLTLHALDEGDEVDLPSGTTNVPGEQLSAVNGQLQPANPY